MIVFSASVAFDQRRISSSVRRQPIQVCASSSLHWLMQGDGMACVSFINQIGQAKSDFTSPISFLWGYLLFN
jgi:hypothetical protein